MDGWGDPEESIFNEDYLAEEGSDDSEEEHEEMDLEVVEDNVDKKLGISEKQAKANLEAAGTEVDEEAERITVAANYDLMNPEVDAILDNIVEDLKIPYNPAEFQRVAVR